MPGNSHVRFGGGRTEKGSNAPRWVPTLPLFFAILWAGNMATVAAVFQLPGTITQDAQMVQVELRPFNDRMLNRDLAILCERVSQASPRLPDGRRLSFTIRRVCCVFAAQKAANIP